MSLVACMCVSSGSAAGSESRASLADASTGLCVSILAVLSALRIPRMHDYRPVWNLRHSPCFVLDDCHNGGEGGGGGTECVEFRASQ